MALQVWLPLNGNLNNQGLANVTVTNNGATVDTAGKIGSCYAFDGADDRIIVDNISIGNNWSYSIWLYSPVSTRSWEGVIILNTNGGDSDMQLGLYTNPNSKVIQNTANGQYNSSISMTYGQWNHFCGTFDGSNLKTYLNGTLVNTKAITNALLSRAKLTIGARRRGDSSFDCYFNGKLNDFRLYDHVLSPKEVKLISQGLVLHYPLNRDGFGCDNLAKNSADLTQWGKESGITVTWDNSVQMFKITGTTHTSSRWGAYQDFNCAANTTYTYSVTGKSVDDAVYLSVGSGAPSNWPDNHGKFTATPTRMSYTFTTGANDTTIRMYLAVYPTESGSRTAYFSFPKLELGSVATPWIPAPSDALYSQLGLNSNIEYDVSGYSYNGTRNGTFSWSSNTARYNSSAIFNGSDNAIVVPFNSIFQSGTLFDYTISVWIYKTVIGSKGYQTIFGGPGGYEIEARASSGADPKFHLLSWGGGQTPYEFNQWTHFCFVHSTTEVKLYVNGELRISGGTPKGNPSGTYFVGAWNSATQQNFEGQMSDFRIYATALTADQVKELYNTPVSIADNGTMLTQGEFVES